MNYYSTPSKGYFALWPFLDLGDNLVKAALSVGCRSYLVSTNANGYAISISSEGRRPVCSRLVSDAMTTARLEAKHRARGRCVAIYRAMKRGRITMWKRLEILHGHDGPTRNEVLYDGTLLEKAFNPRVRAELTEFTTRMSTTVTHELSQTVQPILSDYLKTSALLQGARWGNMSTQQFDELWNKARTSLFDAVDKGYGLAAPGIKQTIDLNIKSVYGENIKQLKHQFLPRVQESFRQIDQDAIDAIARQSGWWIRDQSGALSDKLTTKGKYIVQKRLRDGLGRTEIGKELIKQLPGMAKQYGSGYASTVAAVSVSRARSFSEVATYDQAGIEMLEVMAMLDERTSDICRCMDGQIISVNDSMAHQIAATRLQDPEMIRDVSPFYKSIPLKDKNGVPTGEKKITIGDTGKKFATVQRSGVGKRDDRGQYAKHMSTNKMVKNGVTMPPYHFKCRTMTVPRIEMIQVPKGYELNTTPTPSTEGYLKKPKKKKPGFQTPKSKVKVSQRPLKAHKVPTVKKAVVLGKKKPIDGLSPQKKIPQQAKKVPDNLKTTTTGIDKYNEEALVDLEKRFDMKGAEITGVELFSGNQLEYKYKWKGQSFTYFSTVKESDLAAVKKSLKKKVPKLKRPPKAPKPKLEQAVAPKFGNKTLPPTKPSNKGTEYFDDLTNRTRKYNAEGFRSDTNKSIASRLAKDEDFKGMYPNDKNMEDRAYDFVKLNRDQWEETSQGYNRHMHALQMAIADEFNLPKDTLASLKPPIVEELKSKKNWPQTFKAYKALVRAQYAETQEFLKRKKIKSVHVIRGSSTRKEKRAPTGSKFDTAVIDSAVTTKPANSFSSSPDEAWNFTHGQGDYSYVVKQEVPAERIYGLHATGIGTKFEDEWVILGSKNDKVKSMSWIKNKHLGPDSEQKLQEIFLGE